MAGALSRRDIEMIFRAETDKATRPIGDLTKDVRALRGALEEQIKTAERGDASLEGLAATTRDLKKAQDELGTARSLLTSLNSQVAALDKAEAKLTEATAKYDQLKAQVEGADKPTKRLTNSMEAAGRAQAAAAEQVARINAEVNETRQRVEAVIGPVENFQASFREIADTSKEIARGLALAGTAADDFKRQIAAADAAQAKLASDQAFQQSGRDAGLLQEQINYISQFENRIELLAQAKRELSSQDAAFDQALRAQEAKIGAQNVRELERAFEATAAEQRRLEAVSAFRQLAADANAAATDVARFGVTADDTATSATRLANAIMEINDPTRAALAGIDGVEDAVKRADAVLQSGSKSLNVYANAQAELAQAQRAAEVQAGQIDGYRAQQAALDRSTAKFHAAQAEVRQLAAALPATEQEAADFGRQLKAAEAALESAGQEMQRDVARLASLGAALDRAKIDVNDLATAENRLTQAAREAARAQADLGKKTGRVGASPLGFSLQDMQNLGYQVNDLITQVASGTPIAQAFAQQFGQIYQIPAIQTLIARFAAFIPLIAAAAAVMGTLAAAVSRVNNAAEELKTAQGYVAALGEQGSLTAQQMADASIRIQDFGVSAEDARKAVQDFNEAGLDPQYLDAFAVAAKNASDVTGVEFKDAFNALTEAMQGGYDEVVKLNEQFPVLSDAELEHIRVMYDSGQASEARRIVFERFYDKMDEGAQKMRGAWSNAVDNFKAAFRSFLDYLGSTRVVQNFIQDVNEALVGLNYLLLRARGFSHEEAGRAAVQGGRAPNAPRPQGGRGPAGGNRTGTTAQGQAAIADAERELDVRKRLTKEERLRNAEIDARRKAPKGATDDEVATLAALARQKELNAIRDEDRKKGASAAKKAETARNKAAREAETLANKIAAAEESLQTGLDGMDAKVARTVTGSLTEMLANASSAVDKEYDKLYRKLDDFAKLTGGKGTIGGRSIAEYRAELDANKTVLQNQAQLKVYEDQINAVLNQRKQLLADIEERADRGAITSAEALKESSEVTSRLNPTIVSLSEAAGTFARSIAGANPPPELQAFLDKLDRISGQASTGPMQSDLAKAGAARLGAEEQKLNQIIAERNNLIAANNTLVELGLMTQADAQRQTADAFKNSQPAIMAQVGIIQQTIDEMRNLGIILPQVYDTWVAKLQAVSAQAQYTDANVLALNNLVQTQLIQGGAAMFDSFAKGLAGLVTGTESVGDAFNNLLDTFLNFAATFLLEIGKMILQAMLLQAIQSALGLPGGGGGLGALVFHSGTGPGGVGSGASRRRRNLDITPAMLAAVPRYHQGTQGAGLRNDETLAVVQRGEKILNEEQQRREEAMRASGDNATGLRQVLAFGDDEVAGAMSGPAGERTVVTHLRRNVPLLRQLLRD